MSNLSGSELVIDMFIAGGALIGCAFLGYTLFAPLFSVRGWRRRRRR